MGEARIFDMMMRETPPHDVLIDVSTGPAYAIEGRNHRMWTSSLTQCG